VTDICAQHRPYVAALADDETDLVPPASIEHILDCHACSAEALAHRLINRKLAAGVVGAEQVTRPSKRRGNRVVLARLAAAAVLVVSLGGAGLGWRATREPDAVAMAARVAGEGPTLHSTDMREIASWCAERSSRRAPVIQLPSVSPWGARMDARDGADIVTVFYSVGAGRHVMVGWLDDHYSGPAGTRAEARVVEGQTVVVAQAPTGMAVISGDAPLTVLWSVAGALEGSNG